MNKADNYTRPVARNAPARRLFFCALLAMAVHAAPVLPQEEPAALRVGLTPVFLDDQVGFLQDWRRFLEAQFQRPVTFVQRRSYEEITRLLHQGALEFAWICGLPYVRDAARLELVAVPRFEGRPLYRSYLIVPATDRTTRSIVDLAGAVFAFADPDSNSGFLVPQTELHARGLDPTVFFRRTFFTWSHRDVITAVADGLAAGGAVDGYVWEALAVTRPDLTARTRVAWKSAEYGFPPVVAAARVPADEVRRMTAALAAMSADPQGAELLRRLHLDGFGRGDAGLFEGIRQNWSEYAQAVE